MASAELDLVMTRTRELLLSRPRFQWERVSQLAPCPHLSALNSRITLGPTTVAQIGDSAAAPVQAAAMGARHSPCQFLTLYSALAPSVANWRVA